MKKQKENSHVGITLFEMGKQNVQAEKVYSWNTSQVYFFLSKSPVNAQHI